MSNETICYHPGMVAPTLLLLLVVASPAAAAPQPDPLARARQFYNEGQYR